MNDDTYYNDSSFPEGQVVNEAISQEPIRPQPDVVEAPPVAEAAAPQQPDIETVKQETYKRATQELQERNYRQLRQEKQERDNELYYMRKEMEEMRQKLAGPKKDDIGVAEDAFIERRQVDRLIDARLREQDEKYRRQLEEQKRLESERTLNMQYKDLYQVLSDENLAKLQMQEPEIAATIAANPDIYSAKITAYKLIKKLGIENDNYNARRVDERLTQNALRPKSPATVGRTGSANLAAAASPMYHETITEDMKERHRREMDAAIRSM